MLEKKIRFLSSLDELKAGDIILFRSVYRKNLAQQLIMFYQSLTDHPHGHYETVHAGICLGHDANGPVIAHVTGGNHFSYVKESLLNSNKSDQENRPLIVYRNKDKKINEKIAEKAGSITSQKSLPKWHFSAALKLLTTDNKSTDEKISESTICSKFAIEVINSVTKNTHSSVSISSNSSPKALEAALFHHDEYDLLLYTGSPDAESKKGIDPYCSLMQVIENESVRLAKNSDNFYVKAKYLQLKKALFENAKDQAENLQHQDAISKAQHLLNKVMPVLEINTGLGLVQATSYKNVAQQARKLGIFKWQPKIQLLEVPKNNTITVRLT